MLGVRRYKVVLNTDSPKFLGHDRIDERVHHFTTAQSWDGRDHWFQVYIPSRTAIVLHVV
jgi:1,4-alpha-glucan branching enzyme